MTRNGFYYNNEICTGCRACQIACKDKNDLRVGLLYRQVRSYETGEFPNAGYYHVSSSCNHCEAPACVAFCTTGAMHIAEDGKTVQHDASLCIGDLGCVEACPYGVPQSIEEEGIVGKCDFCIEYVAAGEVPACVGACPLRALEWGSIDDLIAKYPNAVKDIPAIPDSSTTNPSVIISPRAAALESDFQQKFI